MLIKQVKSLMAKEFRLEWKQKFSLSGMLLYVISTLYVCYLSFHQIIDPITWNALFWVISIFAAINAVAKSFIQEGTGQQLFMYTIADPRAIILSKIIYNALLLSFLSIVTFLFYILFIGNLVSNISLFMICIILGNCGLSSILTIVSAIASRANNSSALMAILSFPLLFPLLITILKLSKNIVDGLSWSVDIKYMIILVALNVISITLGYILFPYLWRD
ncbi:MAG: heme exporter protein CcmB [Bacteroidia bacterium]